MRGLKRKMLIDELTKHAKKRKMYKALKILKELRKLLKAENSIN